MALVVFGGDWCSGKGIRHGLTGLTGLTGFFWLMGESSGFGCF